MLRRALYLCLLFLSYVALPVHLMVPNSIWAADSEDKNIQLLSLKIKGLIGASDKDKYNQFFQEISKRTNYNIQIINLPGKRLARAFTSTKKGCLFPDYRAPEGIEIIKSDAFNRVHVYKVRLKNRPEVDQMPLTNLRLGVVNGYGYDFIDLDKPLNVLQVENERQNLNILLRSRVDQIVSYFPDLPLVMSESESKLISYEVEAPLYVSEELIACYNSKKNSEFIDSLNNEISAMNKSGELAKIIAPYFNGLQ